MSLKERIDRLERTNRRYRALLTLVGLGTVTGICISAGQNNTVPEVSRAKMFQVVDDKGQVLVELQPGPRGSGLVASYDKKGNTLAALGGVQIGDGYRGMVVTYNDKGQMVVGLGVGDGGSTGAIAILRDDQKLVTLGSTDDGGTLAVLNKTGQLVAGLGADESRDGLVTVTNCGGGSARTLRSEP